MDIVLKYTWWKPPKLFAALQQRTYVLPSDIEVVARVVLAHRVRQEQSNDDNSKNNDNNDNNEQSPPDEEAEQYQHLKIMIWMSRPKK